MRSARGWAGTTLLGLASAMLLCLAAERAAADVPRVRAIHFTGVEGISPGTLRGAMHLRQRAWWRPFRRNHYYGTDQLEPDLARILALYRAEGYVFARITGAQVRYLSRDWVEIEIDVAEGQRVYVRAASLEGAGSLLTEPLRDGIFLQSGQPLRSGALREDEDRLLRICRDRGYALAEVIRETRFRGDSALVIYQVKPGPLVQVGRISVAGYERTKEQIIRREVVLKDGETFRLSQAATTQERLFDLGLFRTVRIVPAYGGSAQTEQADVVDVDLRVEVDEKPPGWYGLGFGLTSTDRIRLLGEWGYRNLAGRARGLQIAAEISYEQQQDRGRTVRLMNERRVDIVYSEPWLMWAPIRWQARTYYRFNREPTYREDVYSAALRGRRDLTRYRTLTLTLENKWTRLDESVVEGGISRFQTRSLAVGLGEDRRDFVLDPHRGHVSQVLAEYAGGLLGGEASFARWTARYAGYLPLGRRFTWAHRVRAGYIHPIGRGLAAAGEPPLLRVPPDERFYAGGGTTIRGYIEDSLGPREEEQPIGGLALILLNAELRMRLFWQLGMVLFMDAGNIWADYRQIKPALWSRAWTRATQTNLDVVYAVGTGLRFATPVGPLRLDYGLKVARGHRAQYGDGEWHLSLGHAF